MGNEERRIKNVAEYREEILAIAELWRSPVLAFRGQRDRCWLLESSAERRLKKGLKGQDRIHDSLFIEYHRDNLLQTGKLRNYDKREGNQLADLELLADLQHHGAATCLLDFTRNALVALWFACENAPGESGGFDQETVEGLGESHKVFNDGKVFVVNTADERGGFQEVTPRDIAGKSIENVLRFKTRDEDSARERTDQDSLKSSSDEAKFWYWTPAHLNERITAQGSLFLFAPPSSGKPSSEDIVVAAEYKGQIRKELEALYNIHEESLFPDFVGFAYTQRHDAPIDIPDSEEYRRRGIEAAQRGEQQQAIEHYTKAIELQPDDGDTYFRRGRAYYATGSYDLAIQDFTKSLDLNPDNAVMYLSRGGAHQRKGELDLAIQDYTKSLDLNPDNAVVYHLRGSAYYSKGEFDLAIQDFDKAVALDPDDAFTYHLRGSSYYSKGELDLAIQDYTKSLELNPDNAFTYNLRGAAYYSKGELDLAIQDFDKALALDPDNAVTYWSRGSAYYSKGEFDLAIQDFDKALALDPDNAVTYALRGAAHYRKGELDLAIQDFDKALALDPDDAATYWSRGDVYYSKDEFDLAIQDYTKSLDLNPDNAVTYNLRGSAYYSKGEFDLAIQDFDKALALDPDHSFSYFRRSLVWLCMSKWTSAESDLTSARSKGLDITTVFSNMYRSVEDFEQKHRVKLPVGIASMLSTKPSA